MIDSLRNSAAQFSEFKSISIRIYFYVRFTFSLSFELYRVHLRSRPSTSAKWIGWPEHRISRLDDILSTNSILLSGAGSVRQLKSISLTKKKKFFPWAMAN